MEFRQIKKILFSHTPFPDLSEEEKKMAKNTIFAMLFFIIIFMLIVGYVFSPSNFFGSRVNNIEKLIAAASMAYVIIRLYNAIQTAGRNQNIQKDDSENRIDNKNAKIVRKFLVNTVLPVAVILIFLLIEQWLKRR